MPKQHLKKAFAKAPSQYLKPEYATPYETDSTSQMQQFAEKLFTYENLKFVEKLTGFEEV